VTEREGDPPITIYVGAEWAAMSKIEQAAAIKRAIRLGSEKKEVIRQRADRRARTAEDLTLVIGFLGTVAAVALALVSTC
jgi:hypothetical protein